MNLQKYFTENSLPYIAKLSNLEQNEIFSIIFQPPVLSIDFYEQSDLDSKLEKFREIEEKLKLEIPVAYITGEIEINGLKLLTPYGKVLIPRVETEGLIDLVTSRESVRANHILDIGTGTGYIALNLKRNFPNAKVVGIDISRDAVEVAKQNAKLNNLDVKFVRRELQIYKPTVKFDIIVSNPPYIPDTYISKIVKSVKNHEPHVALFAKDDGMEIYRQIAVFAEKYLAKNGKIYLEIFSKRQGFDNIEIFKNLGMKSTILKDVFGKYRFQVFKGLR